MAEHQYEMPPLPGATEIHTSTGVILWVYPLTYHDRQRFIMEARELYTPPNPDDYRKPIPAEQVGYENAFTDGTLDPAYIEAMNIYRQKADAYATDKTLSACVDSPHGVEALIARYAAVVARKTRGVVVEDAWLATLKYAILETIEDVSTVVKAAQVHLPLSAGEVAEGVRIFRPQNGADAAGTVSVRREATPLAKTG